MKLSEADQQVTFQHWTEIKQLSNVVTTVKKCKSLFDETGEKVLVFCDAFQNAVVYRSKIKLHGMIPNHNHNHQGQNAAFSLEENGGMRIQSRNQFMDENSVLGIVITQIFNMLR